MEIQTVQENIYSGLRKMILTGRLRPGERIVERTLAEKFGYSRVPIRESLIRLRAEGLVTSETNKGFMVRKYTKQDVIELFEIREIIEIYAAGKAAELADDKQIKAIERAYLSMGVFIEKLENTGELVIADKVKSDHEFHTSIIDASKNSHLNGVLHVTHGDQILLFLGPNRTIDHWLTDAKEVFEIHSRICKAIKNHNSEDAKKFMSIHLRAAVKSSLKILEYLESEGY
ncbi:MAG: hypothetical protein A2Y12_09655 [Planctomycetes bacterium GWF2_42_9]|nr:MAG: hypothetical protein A2Y12_09655 [Planctomycetes bacterium GWF2_42_9]